MNESINTILNRRSVRAYEQKQIADSDLQTIIEAGTYAPSAINEQPWHFTIVQNSDMFNKINQVCKKILLNSGNKMLEERAKSEDFSVFYNAPALIIVSGVQTAVAPQIDCALALHNMFLAAYSIGISSCWIHALTQIENLEEGNSLIKELGIPDGYKIYCSGAFGYSAASNPAAPPRKEKQLNIIK